MPDRRSATWQLGLAHSLPFFTSLAGSTSVSSTLVSAGICRGREMVTLRQSRARSYNHAQCCVTLGLPCWRSTQRRPLTLLEANRRCIICRLVIGYCSMAVANCSDRRHGRPGKIRSFLIPCSVITCMAGKKVGKRAERLTSPVYTYLSDTDKQVDEHHVHAGH